MARNGEVREEQHEEVAAARALFRTKWENKKWRNGSIGGALAANNTIRGILAMLLKEACDGDDDRGNRRQLVRLGHGDPSASACFQTCSIAQDAIADALRSGKFNSYSPSAGLPAARRSLAEFLSRDLPYNMSSDDIFLTVGCTQAIEIVVSVLGVPGANLLLPRPGFPLYEACAASHNLQTRHFDLLSDKGWEVDLDSVESLADENTVAIVIINPGNPCGSVFSYHHLQKIAETAKKLGILVISDEVYGHITFGSKPFVPMGVFGSIVPIITLGSLSKRWLVPGWRLGWIVVNDPTDILKETKFVERIKGLLNISTEPATFIQAAVPQILQKTNKDFFSKTTSILRQSSDICFNKIKEIDCIICPHKPEGSMFVMVRLDMLVLEDIVDDVDFCIKLAREESVIVLPGFVLGLKNWLRISIATEPSSIEVGMQRMKAFCKRHTIDNPASVQDHNNNIR